MPCISVVMPVYNGANTIREAVNSILSQTFEDFELIIIDDGSTDDTMEVVRSIKDERIKYIENEKNRDIVYALNIGLSSATGTYIARMDADDISLPERFDIQKNFMDNHPRVGACGTWMESFGESEFIWKSPVTFDEVKAQLLVDTPIWHPTAMIRRGTLINNDVSYDQDYVKAEDYKFWFDLSKVTELQNIPKVLLKYRLYEGSTARRKIEAAKRVRKLILIEYLQKAFTEEDYKAHIILLGAGSVNFGDIPLAHQWVGKLSKVDLHVKINREYLQNTLKSLLENLPRNIFENRMNSNSYNPISDNYQLFIGRFTLYKYFTRVQNFRFFIKSWIKPLYNRLFK